MTGDKGAGAWRPDIDGLRAVAILAVIGFHAFPDAVQGGFAGVDVFFVISGYLISGIIFRDVAKGRFSYRDFYARRVRRIFPALLTVLLTCLVIGRLSLFSVEFSRMTENMAASSLFMANIVFASAGGYFDNTAAINPMLHLWSLSVEEQFYLVFPLIARVITVDARRGAFWILALLSAASFWANIVLTGTHPDAAFFWPVTRFWELSLGAMLAWTSTRGGIFLGRDVCPDLARWLAPWLAPWLARGWVRDVASVSGALLAGVAVMALPPGGGPGWGALAPVLGAVLLIAAGPSALVNRTILSTRAALFVGAISYPLYLWHWPILSFARILWGNDLSLGFRVLAMGVSIALATATWQFIEKPVRFGSRQGIKALGLTGGMALAGAGAFLLGLHPPPRDARDAYVSHFGNQWPDYHYYHAQNLTERWNEACNFVDPISLLPRDGIAPACTRPRTGVSVLVWGDSHAQHLIEGLKDTLPRSVSLLQVGAYGCPPSEAPIGEQYVGCNRAIRAALETIASVKPDVVVLSQRSEYLHTDWVHFARVIRGLGAKAVLLSGPVPTWDRALPAIVARTYGGGDPGFISTGLMRGDLELDQALKRLYGGGTDLAYVSLVDHFCQDGACRAFIGPDRLQDIVTFDYGHLTSSASRYVAARALTPAILALITAPIDGPPRSLARRE